MKYILIFVLSFLTTPAISQTNKIEEVAEKLTGIWILESFEHNNVRRIQTEIDNKIHTRTFEDKTLVKSDIAEGWCVVELNFQSNGRGRYQEFYNYKLNSSNQTLELISCQPVPELKLRSNKVVIHLTYMSGECIEEISELTDSKFVLENNEGVIQSFRRVK